MTRNPNPLTDRQIRLLEGVRKKIQEIEDPNKGYITYESYQFYISSTNVFGKIPKIRFKPHSTDIKAEIIRKAGLTNQFRNEQINQIRAKTGITKPRDTEKRILARSFESEWNNIMLRLKKAIFTTAFINNLFIEAGKQNKHLSDPITLLQKIVLEEYRKKIKY